VADLKLTGFSVVAICECGATVGAIKEMPGIKRDIHVAMGYTVKRVTNGWVKENFCGKHTETCKAGGCNGG
jgi:hypothetical protein